MTTTGTRGAEDLEYVMYEGVRICVKPKPLMTKHSDRARDAGTNIGDGS